ncbi:hypothetical protein FACS1894218_2220 [Bacilli bacterium]|nr:hypothetical protein FACS1894218_2220 [Bacilli bacterium]
MGKTEQQNDRSVVYYIVLVGILMSITLVMKVIFHFIPILNGYGIEFHLVGYIFSMMLIRKRR